MSIKDIGKSVLASARREGRELKQETLANALSLFAKADQAAFDAKSNRGQANGIVGSVITAVVVGVVGIVGLLIFSEVNQSITLPSGSNLGTAKTGLEDGFGSAMELLPIVLIVLIASLVIAVISRFR